MAEIGVAFNRGWINSKDNMEFTENFINILKFYLLGTPCELTSSSGQSMRIRRWNRDVWKNSDLRAYLLSKAGLINGITYMKAKRLEAMSDCATAAGLNGNFQSSRDRNRLVFYSNDKSVDILTIFYYIRCSLAHGRFEIYNDNNNERIYALETITKKRGTPDYIVSARMVLKEVTLLAWAETIINGQAAFITAKHEMETQIRNEIQHFINANPKVTKQIIAQSLDYDSIIINRLLNALKQENVISYDNIRKTWISV